MTHSVSFAAAEDTWVVIASDGLFENEVRGGGGGLQNQEVADFLVKSSESEDPEQLGQQLVDAAQKQGTTDDVTVVCLKLAVGA